MLFSYLQKNNPTKTTGVQERLVIIFVLFSAKWG